MIEINGELEAAIAEAAARAGVSVEELAMKTLTCSFNTTKTLTYMPRDEWERQMFSIISDCGVSLPDSALSSEGYYD